MNLKEKLIALRNEVYTIDVVALGNTITKVFIWMMFLFCILTAFSDICFASDIFEAGREIGKQIYKSIVSISTILAGVGIAIAACMYFFSPNERNVASARGWMIRIVLAWVIINGVGLLLATVKNLMGNYASRDLNI